MTKASLLVWTFIAIAGLAMIGLVLLTIVEIVVERRQKRRAMRLDEPDLAIDMHLDRLEQELTGLKEHLQSDYPGGPLVIGDGTERPVLPPKR